MVHRLQQGRPRALTETIQLQFRFPGDVQQSALTPDLFFVLDDGFVEDLEYLFGSCGQPIADKLSQIVHRRHRKNLIKFTPP